MTYSVPVVPPRRSQRWEAVAYWAGEVTPPAPDADFGMTRGFLHDLGTIAYQDRMKDALRAVKERDLLRLIALWPLLARSARSPWDLLRGVLEKFGIIDSRPDYRGPPWLALNHLITAPHTGPPAGADAAAALTSCTGGAVIVV
jgi:hypothetical protein